jgi:hypothetical protein
VPGEIDATAHRANRRQLPLHRLARPEDPFRPAGLVGMQRPDRAQFAEGTDSCDAARRMVQVSIDSSKATNQAAFRRCR